MNLNILYCIPNMEGITSQFININEIPSDPTNKTVTSKNMSWRYM